MQLTLEDRKTIERLLKEREELKKKNIKNVKVVYSQEEPVSAKVQTKEQEEIEKQNPRKVIPGSCAFVPSAVGLILAGEVIKDIAAGKNKTGNTERL